jgi:hypothetical protein
MAHQQTLHNLGQACKLFCAKPIPDIELHAQAWHIFQVNVFVLRQSGPLSAVAVASHYRGAYTPRRAAAGGAAPESLTRVSKAAVIPADCRYRCLHGPYTHFRSCVQRKHRPGLAIGTPLTSASATAAIQ